METELPVLISLGAVFVAIVALAFQIKQSNKQACLQSFTIYTQRYHDIMLNLPISIGSDSFDLNTLPENEKEATLRWLRAYFDLCSEEYYLYLRDLVDTEVWDL